MRKWSVVLTGYLQAKGPLYLQIDMRNVPPASANGQEGRIANARVNFRTTGPAIGNAAKNGRF